MSLIAHVLKPDGTSFDVPYDEEKLGEGGEGFVHLSVDKQYIVKIFTIQKNRQILETIIGAKPKDNTEEADALAWPIGLVVDVMGKMIGILMPYTDKAFWMLDLIWYTSTKKRQALEAHKKGNFGGQVAMCVQIATGARYIFRQGYGYADFSGRNIRANAALGKARIIDLDGLIVKGHIKGNVFGTPGYMAPELVTKVKTEPDKQSDCHAIAVVLYEVLMRRHPLTSGTRTAFTNDRELDFVLRTGKEALYVEHATDKRNALKSGVLPVSVLGHQLANLFHRTFVDGLFRPENRPEPDEYESALKALKADLVQCKNNNCEWGYFPSLGGLASHCPVCKTIAPPPPVPAPPPLFGRVAVLQESSTTKGFFRKKSNAPLIELRGQAAELSFQQLFDTPGSTCMQVLPQKNKWQVKFKNSKLAGLVIRRSESPLKAEMLENKRDYLLADNDKIILFYGNRKCLIEFKMADS